MKFWVLLTKSEIKHLHAYGVHTIAEFDFMRKNTKERGGFQCWECGHIARKTGRA